MANKIIVADTSVLIDYFRKTDKGNARLVSLFEAGYNFAISSITHFEIYTGSTVDQLPFWQALLKETSVLPFNEDAALMAVEINRELKKKRKQIEIADLFIASTAVSNNLPLATLNKNHFERIDRLVLV